MFRFTIRELILLTAIVAITLGWWINLGLERRHSAELAAKNKTLIQANGSLAKRYSQIRQLLERAGVRADAAEKLAGTYQPPPEDR